ncbi:MAG: ribonuclease III domain-containing protein [Eubacteriales bacterium]|nr:ribonuclease III domain-containing protein [Eubacteriales bacterium]
MENDQVLPRSGAIPADVRQWAYIGDAVWHLFVRRHLVEDGWRKDLTRRATAYVSAPAQARVMESLVDALTEQERYIYQRGKNSKYGVVPHNASPKEYHMATGMETLLGWLDEQHSNARMDELMECAYQALRNMQENEEHNGKQ